MIIRKEKRSWYILLNYIYWMSHDQGYLPLVVITIRSTSVDPVYSGIRFVQSCVLFCRTLFLSVIFLLDFKNVSVVLLLKFFSLYFLAFRWFFYSIISQLELHSFRYFRLKEYVVYIFIWDGFVLLRNIWWRKCNSWFASCLYKLWVKFPIKQINTFSGVQWSIFAICSQVNGYSHKRMTWLTVMDYLCHKMTTDMFHLSKTLPCRFLIYDLSPGL